MKTRMWALRVIQGGILTIAIGLPVIFNPLAEPAFEPVKIYLFYVTTVVMTTAALIARYTTNGHRLDVSLWKQWRIYGPLALLWMQAVIYALAAFWSTQDRKGLWGTVDNPFGAATMVMLVLFLTIVAFSIRRITQVYHIFHAILFGSVPVIVYAFIQYLGLDPLPWMTDSVSPVLSTLGRSNFLGAYLSMVVPITLFVALMADSPISRWRYVGLAMVQVGCLWLTQSRAGWVALGAGLITFLLFTFRTRRKLLALIPTVTLVTALGLWGMTVYPLPSGHLPSLHVGESTESASQAYVQWRLASWEARKVIWARTWKLYTQRALFGYGPGNFPSVFAAHYPEALRRFDSAHPLVDDPHNLLLDHLMSVGLVGTLPFVGGVAWILYRVATFTWRNPGVERQGGAAALGASTAYLVQAQFTPDVITTSAFFMLMLASGIALANMDKRWSHG